MISDMPQNNIPIFSSITNTSISYTRKRTDFNQHNNSYLYNQYATDIINFCFVSNPILSTISRVDNILSLNHNWDGYNAIPVFTKSGINTKDFISKLDPLLVEKLTDIFPTTYGTITLEWENDEDKKMTIEIGSNSYSYFVLNSNKTPILVDGKDIFANVADIAYQISNVFMQENA